jgi:hypothetical protein
VVSAEADRLQRASVLLGTLAVALIGVGCQCSPEDGAPLTDGAVLTVDVSPLDPSLGCGAGFSLQRLAVPAGLQPDFQQPATVLLGDERFLAWTSGRLTRTTISRLRRHETVLESVSSPWDEDRRVLLVGGARGLLAIAMPSSTDSHYAWAAWDSAAGEFGAPVSLDFEGAGEETTYSLTPCEGRSALVRGVMDGDLRLGLQLVEWTSEGEVSSSAVDFASGAYGHLPRRGLGVSPEVAQCVADSAGVLHILVFPGADEAPAPVLASFGHAAFRDRPLALGTMPGVRSGAVVSGGTSGLRIYLGTGDGLVAFSLGAGLAIEVGRTSGSSAPHVAAALRRDEGDVVVHLDPLGTWASEWSLTAGEIGPAVRLTDLRCATVDRFRVFDGVGHIIASCSVGAAGADLVELTLCGDTT